MKRILIVLFALLICFNVCAKEGKYILTLREIPLKSGSVGGRIFIYKDCIVNKSGDNDELIDFEGNILLKSGQYMKYYSSADGGFILADDMERYPSDGEFYKRYYSEDIRKYGVKEMWDLYIDSISINRPWAATSDGKRIITDEEPADVVYSSGSLYIRKTGEGYKKFDKKTKNVTDIPYFAARLKLEKRNGLFNIYDTHTGKYIFEKEYEYCDYLYKNDMYYFICGKKDLISIFNAEDTASELKLRPFIKKAFSGIKHHILSCYTGINKVTEVLVFECDGKYYNTSGAEISKAEFAVYSEGDYDEQLALIMKQKFGETVKSVCDKDGLYYLENNGKKVTDGFPNPFYVLSENFVVTFRKSADSYYENNYCIFDTEGNVVLENASFSSIPAVSDNKIRGIHNGIIMEYTVNKAEEEQ